MIPDTINKAHILKALKRIDVEGVPVRRESTGYDLVYTNKRYPPKYVISIAHSFSHGKEWPPSNFNGGTETNNFLTARDFTIVDKSGKRQLLIPDEEDDELGFPEGKEVYRRHKARERNSALSRLAKEKRLLNTGDLSCDVCKFSFAQKYGPRGKGFIEAHHTIPVSKLRSNTKTKIKDIALVCSNCHRMLHRRRPWLTMAELRSLLKKEV